MHQAREDGDVAAFRALLENEAFLLGPAFLSTQVRLLEVSSYTHGARDIIAALLDANPSPSREEVIDAIGGNICRCTGYEPIVEAVLAAATAARAGATPPAAHRHR